MARSKLGQPEPESNLASVVNSSAPQPAHRNTPSSSTWSSSPDHAGSVAWRRSTSYWAGVSRARHSSSLSSTSGAATGPPPSPVARAPCRTPATRPSSHRPFQPAAGPAIPGRPLPAPPTPGHSPPTSVLPRPRRERRERRQRQEGREWPPFGNLPGHGPSRPPRGRGLPQGGPGLAVRPRDRGVRRPGGAGRLGRRDLRLRDPPRVGAGAGRRRLDLPGLAGRARRAGRHRSPSR